ncbi:hypothetical protein G7046_g6425 [Stylonectria norvegica]|nr:hypothetical protein G7046_g6425 [Stylonectria norvegica]
MDEQALKTGALSMHASIHPSPNQPARALTYRRHPSKATSSATQHGQPHLTQPSHPASPTSIFHLLFFEDVPDTAPSTPTNLLDAQLMRPKAKVLLDTCLQCRFLQPHLVCQTSEAVHSPDLSNHFPPLPILHSSGRRSASRSRSNPFDPPDDPSVPQHPPTSSSTEISAPSIVPPGPEASGLQVTTSSANIGSSPVRSDRPSSLAPPQILGRRRRRPDIESQQDLDSVPAQVEGGSGSDQIIQEPPAKRRRADTMMGPGETPDPFNSPDTGYSNGATALSTQRSASGSVTNGHKGGVAVNGSSRNKSNESVSGSRHSGPYFGHDREEVTRLLIQALSDMGYQTAAENVSRDSGYELESPTVAGFRSAVLDGSWSVAEQLLSGATYEGDGQGNGLVLARGSDRNAMRFWLRQQKFLELLEQRSATRALMVLRGELTPLSHDPSKLHFLSSLLMCQSTEDVMALADWDGANGQSRRRLLIGCISPSVMLPESRLAVLLGQVKQNQIDTCLYHSEAQPPSLYSDHFCDRRDFISECALELTELHGEIWQVEFSHDGSKLAACGSLPRVVVWDAKTFAVLYELDHDPDRRGNQANNGICNISWSPDDSWLVTCSQDKQARLWNAETGTPHRDVRTFDEPVSGCVWARDSRSFVLGTLDKNRGLCTFNAENDDMYEWGKKHRVQDVCGSIDGRWLVAVDDLHTIHVYNAITRQVEFDMKLQVRPTSVSISEDSRHLLVNRKDGEAILMDLITKTTVQKFVGHTGGDCLIRSAFGGANESFVTSGSDDGKVFIWHKTTGNVVTRLDGHTLRCNSVSWNPANPIVLASCGDDGRVKIWSSKANALELSKSRELVGSNGFGDAKDKDAASLDDFPR